MTHCEIGTSGLTSSRLMYGCMRIGGDGSREARSRARRAIRAAIEAGFTHFDHADIYGEGICEQIFGEILGESRGLREKMLLTGKCGIRPMDTPRAGDPARYDFSHDHLVSCVEQSLTRLRTDHLDFLLLHRPDFLADPSEVARTFEGLLASGKVLHVGVSNFRPSQIRLLQSFLPVPLHVNQVEINLHNLSALRDGTLDQCLERHMTPQAWCPLGGVAYPAWGNTFQPEDEERIRLEIEHQSSVYGVEGWLIMIAWLLKHPARILPIIGSTTPERIRAATKAMEIDYTREDWYRLLEARNGTPVP